ncbi:MAG: 2-dehydro-3-deoxygalactonokinase [Chitinophagales bacterium]
MEKFLSCDWGTTSFRLRLIQASDLAVIEEESSREGISNSFNLWKQSKQREEDRLFFYLRIIKDHIHRIETKLKYSLKGVPLIVSGMASSSMGMLELPYTTLPFSLDGSGIELSLHEASAFFSHELLIISGCKTDDDVMRGEETKIIGSKADAKGPEELYIFPGTHSKHIRVKGGKVTHFKTFMTGEFFEMLSTKSILSDCVEKTGWADHEENRIGFELGVMDSLQSNILHSAFWVRTNQLFDKLSKEENYFYLSGLLIGTEIKEMDTPESVPITIVSDQFLGPLYEEALRVPGKNGTKRNFKMANADKALIQGQYKIYKKNKI